ncbi:MAG: 3-phosphoshikimate 1-carboxyvinyltransferase [Pyrobaculum sp.]
MFCIKRGAFGGTFRAPPSKPISQRYLLAAALAEGITAIRNVEWSDDFMAMFRAVQPLAELSVRGDVVEARRREADPRRAFNVMESGFTLRTAVAVYAGVPGLTAVYYGGTLRGRPIGELVEALRKVTWVERLPGAVLIQGRSLKRLEAEVRADISSQYVSGLMYLATLAEGGGAVRPVGERKSWSFVETTAAVLSRFGARVRLGDVIEVEGPLRSPGVLETPGDYSLASFLLVAGVITGGQVEVLGKVGELDVEVLHILRDMGAVVNIREDAVSARGVFTKGVKVDLGHSPDLVIPVALAAAFVDDLSVIRGVEHLRYKESDRVDTVLDVLRRLGVEAEYRGGSIHIRGPPTRSEVTFSTHGDHRIGLMAMTAARAVGGCVDDITPVAKSWPTFITHISATL